MFEIDFKALECKAHALPLSYNLVPGTIQLKGLI